MEYEYRVTWRREHDRRSRQRIYQTEQYARAFASFIETPLEDQDLSPHSTLGANLESLGDAVNVTVQRRSVGAWEIAPS